MEGVKLSQREMIKAHLLQNKSITPIEALEKYGCFRLASRISELRREGWDIETETNPVGKQYAVYTLVLPFEGGEE